MAGCAHHGLTWHWELFISARQILKEVVREVGREVGREGERGAVWEVEREPEWEVKRVAGWENGWEVEREAGWEVAIKSLLALFVLVCFPLGWGAQGT